MAAMVSTENTALVKNIKVTVDASTVQSTPSSLVGIALVADDDQLLLDYGDDLPTTSAPPPITDADGNEAMVLETTVVEDGNDENQDDEVTFRVTMDEKKMEMRLFGEKNKKPAASVLRVEGEGAANADDGSVAQRVKLQQSLDMTTDVLSTPQNKERRIARAKRFGTTDSVRDFSVTEDLLRCLYDELGIDERTEKDRLKWRLDTIHLRGVNEMSTYDVQRFFGEFFPSRIEWIDDVQCNVVFADDQLAARSLLDLSQPMQRRRPVPGAAEDGEVRSTDDEEEGEIVVRKRRDSAGSSDDEDEEEEQETEPKEPQEGEQNPDVAQQPSVVGSFQSPMKRQPLQEEEMEAQQPSSVVGTGTVTKETSGSSLVEARDTADDAMTDVAAPSTLNVVDDGKRWEPIEVDMAKHMVPPGKWRVASKHCDRARLLLVRFASYRDVKTPGAMQRSEYYRKYGNPRLHGAPRGLLSAGAIKRRRIHQGTTFDLRNRLGSRGSVSHENRRVRKDAFDNKWMNRQKVRAGLDIYDKEGKELEWDYEHDTRFFDGDKKDGGDNSDTSSEKVESGTAAKRGRRPSTDFVGFGDPLSSSDESPNEQNNRNDAVGDKKRRLMTKSARTRGRSYVATNIGGMRADEEEMKMRKRASTRRRHSGDSPTWGDMRHQDWEQDRQIGRSGQVVRPRTPQGYYGRATALTAEPLTHRSHESDGSSVGDFYEDEGVPSPPRSSRPSPPPVSPTPQPWDPPSDITKMKVTVENDRRPKSRTSTSGRKHSSKHRDDDSKRRTHRKRRIDNDINMDSDDN